MNTQPIEDEIDPELRKWLKQQTKWQQVQYSTKEQLVYLVEIAYKFGLYDAAEVLKRFLEKN